MMCRTLAALILFAAHSFCVERYTELCQEAASLSQQGNYEAAIQRYRTALTIHPGAPEVLNNLAVMYYEVRRYAEAFDIASQLWQKHPELKSAALIAGMAAVQCSKPQSAIGPLETLIAEDPTNRDAVLALASARIALGDLPGAAAIYKTRTGESPKDPDVWYGLALCYEQMAEQASRELSKTPGGSAYSKRLAGEYLQSVGDEKLAAEAFGESATIPEGGDTAQAGKLYALARELASKSRDAFEEFVELAPDSWQAALFVGDVDRQHGDLAAALASYKKVAEHQPNIAAPLLGMGTVYWELGQFDRATGYLKDTLRLNPKAMQAVFELGNIAVREHRDREAIPLLMRYLDSQPDALAARADLGRAYMHLGKYENAVEELTKAATSDERGEIHYELSVALRKLGRTEEADSVLMKSKQIKASELERQQRLHTAH
jgi:tetratricopeptide (TPR) repeat protein